MSKNIHSFQKKYVRLRKEKNNKKMEKEKDSFFGTESPRSEINEDAYSSGSQKSFSRIE